MGRARPYQLFDDVETPIGMAVLEYSFPSGHSCGSMICWTFLYDRLRVGRTKQQRAILYIFSWVVVAFASGSRIYFCVHFPHDVIGGWLLSYILYRLYTDWDVLPSVHAIIGLFGILLLTCLFSSVELLLHMPGLVICTAALSGILICMNFRKHLPLTSPLINEPVPVTPFWKQAARVIMGTIFFTITGVLQVYISQSIVLLFLSGFIMSLWLFWLAP